jgi:hypothetical protein
VLDLPATSAMVVGNPGIEPGRHKGAGFTGPLSPQTWRYPDWLRGALPERASRGYEPRPGRGYRSGHPPKGGRGCKRLRGAGVRPAWHDRSWRRAEDLSLTPFGAIGVRSRAGAPVRLTLQHWDDASSNRHPNLSSCLSMISAQTRSAFVARENRCPLFRIML